MTKSTDFSQGSVPKLVMRFSVPLIMSQLVDVLYGIVDRIFIGHIPLTGSLALTGVGIAAPILSVVASFAGLFGQGGGPLCSIERGKGNDAEAERLMGNTFGLLIMSSAVIMALVYIFMKPLLFAFGATWTTVSQASEYMRIYLIGTPFVFISLGMNVFISSQGYAILGMLPMLIGAVTNIILDPILIFLLDMGVAGAAIATVVSQTISAVMCISIIMRKTNVLRLRYRYLIPDGNTAKRIMALGTSDFLGRSTTYAVQALVNRQLGIYGNEYYIGAITVINSLRSIFIEVFRGLGNGVTPVLGFNYGAGDNKRVIQCIRFSILSTFLYSLIVWCIFMLFPEPLVRLFTEDRSLIDIAVPATRIYFCCFVFMSIQFSSQNGFRALGRAKECVFFSFLRKVYIVVPLILLLPGIFGLGADGVYWSEPISDVIGGMATFGYFMLVVYRPIAMEARCENPS